MLFIALFRMSICGMFEQFAQLIGFNKNNQVAALVNV